MGTIEKLIERFKRLPKDFTWDELVRLFGHYGFEINNKGRTSGSRVEFENGDLSYIEHKPHPKNTVKMHSLKRAKKFLENNNYL